MTEFKIGIEEFIWPFSCRITPKITRESHLNTLASFWVAAPAGIQLRTDCTKSSILLITWKFCPFSGLHRLINQARTEIISLRYSSSPAILEISSTMFCYLCFYFILGDKNTESQYKLVFYGKESALPHDVANPHRMFFLTLNILPVYYRNYSKRSSNFLQFNRSRE